jgi:hypothetical protein
VIFSANAALSAKMFFHRHGLAVGLFLLALFKLWLVHTDEIYGSATEYDALWFVNAAKHWYWGAEYSWTAFVRPPAYPLFIAVVHLCALPLRIGIELMQMAGYLMLVAGFRKAGVPRLVCLASYGVMILHPASQFNRCTMADTFYAAILPLALGGLLLTLFTAKPAHATWTGIALAVLWNTREESFLIPAMLVVFLGIALSRQRSAGLSWKAAVRYWLKPAGAMLGTLLLLNSAVDVANYRAFRSFSKSEMTSSGYRAAFKALLRIKPRAVQRFVPISTEALETAYTVSPTFAQLKPQFEGDLGRMWQVPTFAALGVHEMGPWFMFGFRSAANAQGLHKNAASAQRFYRNVAKEINRACDEGRIPSRLVLSSFLDPGAIANIRYMPQSLVRNAGLFVLRYQTIADRDDDILTKSQRVLYDEMTNRRAPYRKVGTLNIAGWAFQFGDPVKFIAFKNHLGEIEASTDRLSEGPDIVARFASDEEVPLRNHFVLSVDLFRIDGLKGDLVFITQSGAEFREKAAIVLGGGAPAGNGKALMCHIDSQELITVPADLSDAFVNFIGNYHRFLVIGLSVGGLTAALMITWRLRHLRVSDPLNATLILLAATVFLRVLFFTFLDATWWEGGYERYLLPVMPLYSCFLILLIYQSFALWRRVREIT